MTWTGQSFSVGQILTAAQMNNLQADITAHANGDSGAPKQQTAGIATDAVGQSEIAANSVGQSELKKSTGNQSTSIDGSSAGAITPTGGDWTHNWFCDAGNSSISVYSGAAWANNDSSPNTIRAYNSQDAGNFVTFYVRSSYHTASPPYNLGYGEIPKFLIAYIDKNTKEVLGVYDAPDPPWAYHGPHILHPVQGPLLRAVGLWGKNVKDEFYRDPEGTTAKLRQMKEIQKDKKALTKCRCDHGFTIEDKNIDMDTVPHLFAMEDKANKVSGYNPDKHALVMLDPCGPLTEELALVDEFTESDFGVLDLLHKGYLEIDNSPLSVERSPAGVLTVGYKWKNTGDLK